MLFFKNSLLLIKSVYILFTEYTKYKLNIIDQIETFNNITNRLSNLNILYTKLLQWVINDTIFFNDDIKKNFEKFTDNVEYTESDIDYLSLLEIVNTHDIKLDSLKPFKSGTISIVFKGMLDDDKPVVIKMIKKNIHARLLESIEFFKLLGNVSRYIPYLCQFNLDSLIKYNSNELLLQTNFVKEAENIELFYSNFKNNSNIIIPRVYKDFTNMNNNVIVMDYIKGVSAYSINFEERDNYSRVLYEFIFECIFKHEIFHGDLHPGNVLFIKDESSNASDGSDTSKDKYKIGIVDYGIVGRYDPDMKKSVCTFFKKLVDQKYHDLFKLIIDNLTEPLDNSNDITYSKEEIIDSLLVIQKKYNILYSMIKADDIYYMNKKLKEYNLVLSLEFSKLFLFVSSMYSLLFIIRHNTGDGLFETVFNEYCENHVFTYLYFMD